MERGGDYDGGHGVDGGHVDGVCDVRAGGELEAAFEEAEEEVVRDGCCGLVEKERD